MYILRFMFVISGSSLYPGFTIEKVNCTRSIAGAICCFHVNQNFILSNFVSTRFNCTVFRANLLSCAIVSAGMQASLCCSVEKVWLWGRSMRIPYRALTRSGYSSGWRICNRRTDQQKNMENDYNQKHMKASIDQ